MATLAELTGVKAPAHDGVSFLPTLLGKDQKQQVHNYLYFEFPEKGGQLAIRMGNWKGVKRDLKKNPAAPWEIYDLGIDEKETKDLAAQQPELVKRFDEIVKQEHQHAHIHEWEFVDPKFDVKK